MTGPAATTKGLRSSGISHRSGSNDRASGGRRVALATLGVFVVALTAGVVVPTGLEVPARDSSISGLLTILRSNLVLLAVIGSCAGLQTFARREVEEGSQPWIRRITDMVVAVFVTLNVAAAGFVIGQLGVDAVIRIVPHGILEVPAFTLAVWGYLLARKGRLDPGSARRIYITATLLLLVAAPIETFITGSVK